LVVLHPVDHEELRLAYPEEAFGRLEPKQVAPQPLLEPNPVPPQPLLEPNPVPPKPLLLDAPPRIVTPFNVPAPVL
jgi:hypothetical protein